MFPPRNPAGRRFRGSEILWHRVSVLSDFFRAAGTEQRTHRGRADFPPPCPLVSAEDDSEYSVFSVKSRESEPLPLRWRHEWEVSRRRELLAPGQEVLDLTEIQSDRVREDRKNNSVARSPQSSQLSLPRCVSVTPKHHGHREARSVFARVKLRLPFARSECRSSVFWLGIERFVRLEQGQVIGSLPIRLVGEGIAVDQTRIPFIRTSRRHSAFPGSLTSRRSP